MADSNRLLMRFKEEAAYKTPPGGAAWNLVRFTGESLAPTQASTRSEEIESSRMTTAIIRTDVGAAGDINAELLYADHDKFYEYGIQSDTTFVSDTPGAEVDSVGATVTTNVFTEAGGWSGYAIGDWIETKGFTDPANNGVFKITNIAGNDVTVQGDALVTEAGAPGKKARGSSVITNGVALDTGATPAQVFTLEKAYQDLTNEFAQLNGGAVTGFTVSGERGGILQSVFNVIAAQEVSAAASDASGDNALANTTPINSVDHVLKVHEALNLTDTKYDVTALNLACTNAVRAQGVMGTLGATGLGNGSLAITGSHAAYFTTKTVMDKFLGFVTSQLAYVFKDEAGNVMVFELPAVKYTGGQRVAGGKDTDILAEMTYEVFKFIEPNDSANELMIRIAKIAAWTP